MTMCHTLALQFWKVSQHESTTKSCLEFTILSLLKIRLDCSGETSID
jgi:hypothetical protein